MKSPEPAHWKAVLERTAGNCLFSSLWNFITSTELKTPNSRPQTSHSSKNKFQYKCRRGVDKTLCKGQHAAEGWTGSSWGDNCSLFTLMCCNSDTGLFPELENWLFTLTKAKLQHLFPLRYVSYAENQEMAVSFLLCLGVSSEKGRLEAACAARAYWSWHIRPEDQGLCEFPLQAHHVCPVPTISSGGPHILWNMWLPLILGKILVHPAQPGLDLPLSPEVPDAGVGTGPGSLALPSLAMGSWDRPWWPWRLVWGPGPWAGWGEPWGAGVAPKGAK